MTTVRIFKQEITVSKKATQWIIGLCGGFLLLTIIVGLATTLIAKKRVYYSIEDLPEYQTGIIFGTTPRALNGLPNSYFTYRMRGAVDLYKAGKIKQIIVSGDNRTFKYNEPRAMRKALEQRGVNPADIIEDYAGRDTYDSVIRARDIFGVHKHLYITQRFQADRAITIATWNKIDAHAYIVPETKNVYIKLKLYFREYLARVKMIFTLLLGVQPAILGDFEPVE